MPFAFVANRSDALGVNGGTTTGITTTGANFIVGGTGYYVGGTGFTLTDNKNTPPNFTGRASYSAADPLAKFFDMLPTTVGTSHTFTEGGTGIYSIALMLAFSGGGSATFDKEAGTTGTGSTAKPGALTPTNSDSLHVSIVIDNVVGTSRTIDSSFTIPTGGQVAAVGGTNYGGAIAYRIISGAGGSLDPEWSGIGTAYATAHIIYNVGGGGGGGIFTPFFVRSLIGRQT